MKRSPWAMLLLAGAVVFACAHAKTTDDGTTPEAEKDDQTKKQAGGKSGPAPGAGGPGSELHPGDRQAVPVATAPDVLLSPGADDQIRQRLVAQGFLAKDAKPSASETREAIRKFQRAKDLPATGVPDHETVKRLGLDPEATFRRGTVKD